MQLWAESLGKDGKGYTPLSAVGPTDQHSILQLLRDGPDDKLTLFMKIDRAAQPVTIPSISRDLKAELTQKIPSFRLLEGHTLHELVEVECQAVSQVLTKRGRPHATLQLDDLNEASMGGLYFALSTLTALTGSLLGVNPFDQPGVEEGKVYIRDTLSYNRTASNPDDENSPVNRLRRNNN